jgi:hypothetical protein
LSSLTDQAPPSAAAAFVGIEREQRVPHHVGVVAGDVGGGPDRIDDLQVPIGTGSHGLHLLRRCAQTTGEQRSECRDSKAA